MIKKTTIILLLLTTSLFSKEVTVSIVPQKFFVEQIVKDKMQVNVMVKPGFSPATYEPRTSQMKKLANSELYFSIGVAFEDVWIKRFKSANRNLKIIDTSKGIEKIAMSEHHHHDEHKDEHDEHKDEHEDEHEEHKDEHEEASHEEHEGLDPHIWLDPTLVKIQAKNIYDAVSEIDPKNRDFYTKNYKEFISRLDSLDTEIVNILKETKNRVFMVFHPSWGYFAKAYKLEQIAVEIEGKEPKPKELIELINEAKEENIKIVFVAPQFSKKAARIIAKQIDGKVQALDPLEEDYKSLLINTATAIRNQ